MAMARPCQGGVVCPSSPEPPVWPPLPEEGMRADEWCAAAETTAEEGVMRPDMLDTEDTPDGLFSIEVGAPKNWPKGFTLQKKKERE